MFRKIYPLILLTSSLAIPAGIQAQEMKPNHMPTPNFDLYGGYSYVFTEHGAPPGTITTSGSNGWDAALKVPLFTPWLGIKGDVSGVYNNDNSPNFNSKTIYFLFGPQVSAHFGRTTLFAHGMVGSAHLSDNALPSLRSSNSLATAVGGGLDAGIGRFFAWRVTGDYYNTHFHQTSTTDATVSEILNSKGRISTGPIFRF